MSDTKTGDPRATALGFIHLTDLHAGQPREGGRVPDIEDALIRDLKQLVTGDDSRPRLWIDVVFFTGDIAFKGAAAEFGHATAILGRVLGAIRRFNTEAGAPESRRTPLLLPVPGNHDLARPSPGIARQIRAGFRDRSDNAPPLWSGPTEPTRPLVKACFAEYMAWLDHPLPFPPRDSGNVPGDMKCSVVRGGIRLGVIGLNSAYLHLDDGGEGTQHIDRSQLERLVGAGRSFADRHDVTVLMTHHPPASLSPTGRKVLDQGVLTSVDLHLYGHAHVGGHVATPGVQGTRHGLMGRSLFGAEEDGYDRLHGYTVGRVRLEPAGEHMTPVVEVWSRPGWLAPDGRWHLGPALNGPGDWRTRIDFAPVERRPAAPDTPAAMPEGLGEHARIQHWPRFTALAESLRGDGEAMPAGSRKRWLFLSASVPGTAIDREVKPEDVPFVRSARPGLIAATIVQLARRLAKKRCDVGLLFAGAPSITRHLAPVFLETRAAAPWVLLVQAEWYRDKLIEEVPVVATLDGVQCATWHMGHSEDGTLDGMRAALAGTPGLVGSVYIGGKGGIVDEFAAFGQARPELPRLALGIGGGAAASLLLGKKGAAAAHGRVKTGKNPRKAIKRAGRLWHTPEDAVEAICEVFDIK